MTNTSPVAGTLRAARVPELEGTRLRLHVERLVFGLRPERGQSRLLLTPSGDPSQHDEEAMVYLPLNQADAMEEACAAFNAIMDQHEMAHTATPTKASDARLSAGPRTERHSSFIHKETRMPSTALAAATGLPAPIHPLAAASWPASPSSRSSAAASHSLVPRQPSPSQSR